MELISVMATDSNAKENVQVSVVVVAHNSARCIKRCLDSIFRTRLIRFEVVVVDDSDDETRAIASKYGSIRLVRLRENIGVAKARNLGAALARGDYLAFVDDNTTTMQENSAEPGL
jgi:glycosyltransferase involved in cell wall biosynthesis